MPPYNAGQLYKLKIISLQFLDIKKTLWKNLYIILHIRIPQSILV